MDIVIIVIVFNFILKSVNPVNICSQNIITGRGTSALSDRFISYIAMEFQSNRSLANRNTKLLYFTDSLINSENAITKNSTNPAIFAANLVPMFNQDYPPKYQQQLKTFPLFATSIVMIYNVPNVSTLTLSLDIVSSVYQGLIKTWNHDKIQALNSDCILPPVDIKVVARQDDSGTTYSLTSVLSGFDEKWKENYGIFSNPELVRYQNESKSKWPSNSVTYFASGGTGLVGILTSIPFTLGYTTLGNAQEYNMPYAALANIDSQPLLPTLSAVQAAIDYYSLINGEGLVYDLYNAKLPNAYPLVTFVYFAIDMDTHPKIECCAMEETVAFFDWLLYSVNSSMIQGYGFVPLPSNMATQINTEILRSVKCQNVSVYDNYLRSLSSIVSTLQLWHIFLIFVITILLLMVAILLTYSAKVHQKRKADQTKWFIPAGKLKPSLLFETDIQLPTGRTTSTSIGSNWTKSNSSNSCASITKLKLKYVLEVVDLEGDEVYLQPLKHYPYPLMWKQSTKKLMLKFTQQLAHKNINRIRGIALYNNSFNLVQDFVSKGTLHYVLQKCQYDINDNVKYSLAIDVATGMQYLVSKDIYHCHLSSISCCMDSSWSLKICEWGENSLSLTEGVATTETCYLTESSSENDFIRLIYKDYEIFQNNTFLHDVFSFGMLLIEIFSRNLPYHEQTATLTYPQIFDEKINHHRHIEPDLKSTEIPTDVIELIKQCSQLKVNRPKFTEILLKLNKFKSSKKGIVDTMMEIVESHAANLQKKSSDLLNLNTRMEELLHEVLPPQIASKLFQGESVAPECFECITICFADVVGFTTISAKSYPREVMAFLNDLWLLFDNIVHQFDAYKIDTIGDAYLVCSGLPQRNGNAHCKEIASLSLRLIEQCEPFKILHLPNEKLMIRVGINSGSVTAGIVGSKMPQYCIFGDTVNVAARMQSTSLPSKIHVSESTFRLLSTYYNSCFRLEERGNIDVKGKGVMTTFWLLE